MKTLARSLAYLITCMLAAGVSLSATAFEHDGPPGRGRPSGAPAHNLSEAQEDKLFAIMHAQEPQRREHERAARKANEALRELADSGKFDESRAAALAQAEGKAIAALSLLHARADAQAAALLTPEQRQEFKRPPQPPRP